MASFVSLSALNFGDILEFRVGGRPPPLPTNAPLPWGALWKYLSRTMCLKVASSSLGR